MNDSGLYPARRKRANEAWDTVDTRLVGALLKACPSIRHSRIWEPAAGRGLMVGQLRAAGCKVALATDIESRAKGVGVLDFLSAEGMLARDVDAIVTNPPWGRSSAPFVRHALKLARPSHALVAMLLPLPWLTAAGVADMTSDPGLAMIVIPRFRAKWMTAAEEADLENGPSSPKMNHVWLVWTYSVERWPEPTVIFVDAPREEEK